MLRKRYMVVVIGKDGVARSQRSELSRHRSEREAREAAEDAAERLTAMHADRASRYLVVVERDGQVLPGDGVVEAPAPRRHPAAEAPPPVEEHVRRIPREDSGSTAELPAITAPDDAADRIVDAAPWDHEAERPDAATRERQRVRMPAIDDIPSGRVPEDVLRRFEEAIAREERRRIQRPGMRE